MIDLSQRSYESELMDRDDIPFSEIAITLEELNTVNTRLGGHSTTIRGINELKNGQQELVVCEIGCGGGDNLRAIQKKFKSQNIQVRFIGIDKNPECIAFAQQRNRELPCEWICSDYAAVEWPVQQKPDIIFSSLFCHHFTDEQMSFMLPWLSRNSRLGFFINDLHRHWLAFYLIKYITRVFSKSRLVRHDASLSVARGFKKKDWARLLHASGITNYQLQWRWAFRWLLVVNSSQHERGN